MGKALSVLNRKVNRFNVENRAHRVISKDKPTPAPRHPSNAKRLDEIATVSDFTEIMKEQSERNEILEDRLKQVYVQSHDPEVIKTKLPEETQASEPAEKGYSKDNKLPLDRQPYVLAEYGIHEPAVIPRGRCTLRQAIKFISDHQADPATWTSASIAESYKLSQDNVDKILKHYRTFEVYLPERKDKTHQPLVAGPTTSRKIGSGKSKDAGS